MNPLPSPGEVNALRQQNYNATIISLQKVHSDLAIFRVRPDFPFQSPKPGQYTTLGLGNWEPRHSGCAEETLRPGDETRVVRRAYSISHPVLAVGGDLWASDGEGPFLEFYVVLVRTVETPGAPALTPRLFMLQEGDRLHLGEKFTGHYTLDAVGPDHDLLFLSTGTGEAPHNYMVWELLRRGHRGSIVTVCCTRYLQDLAYMPTHQQLMRAYPNYLHVSLTTREAVEGGRKVYIQDLIVSGELEGRTGRPLDPGHTHVFLCGNPSMIGIPHIDRATGERRYPSPVGAVEILEQRGFQADQPRKPGNVHFEKYW
jgi:ferredoxin--NADP+ reductase